MAASLDVSGETAVIAQSNGAPHADSQEAVKQPAWSTRGAAPGLRGCWALNRQGQPCGAPRRNDGEYCSAHSGLGVAADPKGHSRIGVARSVENRQRRAELRLAVGVSRLNTPRGVLAAETFRSAERVARRVVGAVLDPAVPPATAAKLGLDLINVVDPQAMLTAQTSIPSTPEGVADLSLGALLSIGEQMGIPLPNGSTEPLPTVDSERA